MDLGRRIARYRKLKRWSQAQLAQAANVSTGYIALIEEGRRTPRPKTLAIIAASLGVGLEELYKGETDGAGD